MIDDRMSVDEEVEEVKRPCRSLTYALIWHRVLSADYPVIGSSDAVVLVMALEDPLVIVSQWHWQYLPFRRSGEKHHRLGEAAIILDALQNFP